MRALRNVAILLAGALVVAYLAVLGIIVLLFCVSLCDIFRIGNSNALLFSLKHA